MHGSAPLLPRPTRWLPLALGSLGIMLLASALSYRIPLGLDAIDLSLRANGARLLLAAAAGVALAVAGALARLRGVDPLREPTIFAVSVGAAAGGALALKLGAPLALALAAGLFGAALLAGLVRSVGRGSSGGLAMAFPFLLALLFFVAVIAAGAGSTESAGSGGAVLWVLGDLSRARLPGALLALGLAIGLSATAAYSLRGASARVFSEPGERDEVEGAEASKLAATGTPRTLGALLFGLGVGAAGPVAFLGLFASSLVLAMLGRSNAAAPVLLLVGLVGAASLVAADAGSRALHGGYTFPLNVSIGIIAIPIFLAWRWHTGRGGARNGWRRGGEAVVALVGTAALGFFAFALTSLVRAL